MGRKALLHLVSCRHKPSRPPRTTVQRIRRGRNPEGSNFCFPDFGGIRKEPVTWAIVGTGEFNGDDKSDFSGVTRAAMLDSC
jgi:hypothetical protein